MKIHTLLSTKVLFESSSSKDDPLGIGGSGFDGGCDSIGGGGSGRFGAWLPEDSNNNKDFKNKITK